MHVHDILQLIDRYASPGSIIYTIYIGIECVIYGTIGFQRVKDSHGCAITVRDLQSFCFVLYSQCFLILVFS